MTRLLLAALLLLASWAQAANFYPATALTGGGTGALDKLNASNLNDKDVAFVVLKADPTYGTATLIYVLDAASGATPDGVNVILPAGTAGAKRWVISNILGSFDRALSGEGLVYHFRSDSATCNPDHPAHAETLTKLDRFGLRADNIACDSGFPAMDNLVLVGVSGTGGVGSIAPLTPDAYAALSGSSGTGALGSLLVYKGTAALAGISGSGALGTILATIPSQGLVSLSGNAGTAAIGDLVARYSAASTLSGVAGTGATGVVETHLFVTAGLTGISGTGAIASIATAAVPVPTLSSASIGTDGTTVTLTFDKAVYVGAGGSSGWTLQPSVPLSGVDGTGSAGTLTATSNQAIAPDADGDVEYYGAGASWATVRGAATGTGTLDDTALRVMSAAIWDGELEDFSAIDVQRSFLRFTIPSGTYTAATLKLTPSFIRPTTPATIIVKKGTQALTLGTADYDSFDGATDYSGTVTVSSTERISITLNSAGISYINSVAGGTAKLCLIERNHDHANVSPATGSSDQDFGAAFRSVDYGTAGDRPSLELQ